MISSAIAILDTGPLVAAALEDELHHAASVATLARPELQLVIPALVAGEATYLVGSRAGARAEARFLAGLGHMDVEAPAPEDWPRMAELVAQYGSFPLGGVDASVVALAERLETELVITLDRRHFAAIRPRHCTSFQLLPE